MQPRPGTPARRPVPRPSGRPSAPSARMDDRVDSMRIGGFVMLALAASQLLEKFVLSFWLDLDKSTAETAGAAVFDALLGVAMLQGSNAARKVVLFLTGLATLALLGLMALLLVGGYGHLWPVLAASLLTVVGVFVLNLFSEQSRAMVFGALAMVLVGWVGSIAASIALAGAVDLASLKAIREWSSPQRTFEDAEAGITMKVPAHWVLLKEGSPLAEEEKSLVTAANTEVEMVAHIVREMRTYSSADNLQFFLDGVAKAEAAKRASFEAGSRNDATVGGVLARRMKVSWKEKGQATSASFTAWQDGPFFYYLSVTAPRVISKRLDQEADALAGNVAFSAPWTVFLREKAAATRKECPLLTDTVILGLAHSIPRNSAPEVYCREAYRLAFVGQPLLDAASSQRLGARMKTFFAALPRAKSERFGAYAERLRAGQATAPAEDREMMQAARAAMESLDGEIQDDLRAQFAVAVEMGRFAGGMGAR